VSNPLAPIQAIHLRLHWVMALIYFASAVSFAAPAAGKWSFVVRTDLARIPPDMRENFPTVDYEKCLSTDDIQSPRGFGLQASPAMWNRCGTDAFTMEDGKLNYRFQCDAGATLTGEVQGVYQKDRVELRVISRPRPVVREIDTIYQTITARRVGTCSPG
jgi:hypothetical protein